MKSSTSRLRLLPVPAAIVLLLALAGCDTGTNDTIILNDIRVEFEFERDGADLTEGTLQDLPSTASFNIASQLSSLGFSTTEITSSRVLEATIELVIPSFVSSGIDLRAFDEVILQLDSGGTVREVASRTGFAAEEPASLNVIQNRDISSIVRGGDFVAVLQVNPSNVDAGETYLIEVVLKLSVEVEGV